MDEKGITALAHSGLDFNAPLSEAHAARLTTELASVAPATVLDLGCGWGELLLRLVAAVPSATGTGVDTNSRALNRARHNAGARQLAQHVQFEHSDAAAWSGDAADAVMCIGASHAWSRTDVALRALRRLVRPGGQLLFAHGFWERAPTAMQAAALGAEPDEFGTVTDLVDLARACGYRLWGMSVASQEEWDTFESRWCAGLERWLAEHPDALDVDQVRAVADQHRDGYLNGYRGLLGFAYLRLARVN